MSADDLVTAYRFGMGGRSAGVADYHGIVDNLIIIIRMLMLSRHL
jgi:hypothetical protein